MSRLRRFASFSLTIAGALSLGLPVHATPSTTASPEIAGSGAQTVVTRSDALQNLTAEMPLNHWAYDALFQIAQRGVAIGRPAADVSGKRTLTRFQLAMATEIASRVIIRTAPSRIQLPTSLDPESAEQLYDQIHRVMGKFNAMEANSTLDRWRRSQFFRRDIDAVQKLNLEFRDELEFMGVDMEQRTRNLQAISERCARLQQRLVALVDLMRKARRRTSNSMPESDPDHDLDESRLW